MRETKPAATIRRRALKGNYNAISAVPRSLPYLGVPHPHSTPVRHLPSPYGFFQEGSGSNSAMLRAMDPVSGPRSFS
jgi:hypothetical protein